MTAVASEWKPKVPLTAAMTDPDLFGKVFRSPSFWTWRVIAKLIDGLPLTEQREIKLYQECTGRSRPPNRHLRRLIALCWATRRQRQVHVSGRGVAGRLVCQLARPHFRR